MKKRHEIRAGIVILLILVMLFGCTSDRPEPTPSVGASPTDSRALFQTPVSTQPEPSQASTATARRSFPTSTIIPTRLPTPTLWYGTPVPSAQYQLVEWTPALAEKLIAELEAYPDTLDEMERGRYYSEYYYAYHFASLAEAEAAYRFPDSAQAETWLWASAYNWLQSYRSNVGPIYSRLIVEALNQGKTDVTDLKSWFEGKEPRLSLEVIPLDLLRGYRSSQIIFIETIDEGSNVIGGTYFWLLEDDSGFSIYSLESNRDYGLIDFETGIAFEDLTGDDIPEAIVTHIDWESGNWHGGDLEVFDLQEAPPKKLEFDPLPDDFEIGRWNPWVENNQLQGFQTQIAFYIEVGGCGWFGPTWNYRFDGTQF